MSHIIQAQLEIEGYDATTAAQIVRTVEAQTEDVARDYLGDLVESAAAIDRYIRARAKKVPESRTASAKAAIDRTRTKAGGSGLLGRGHVASPAAAAPAAAAAVPAAPALSTHIKQSQTNKSGPYSRGGFGSKAQAAAQAAAQAPPAAQAAPKENRQYKIDTIADLDAAIRDLDLAARPGRAPCDCMGSLHGLLEMAPNCLNCGKVVCNKEGLGNCLGCGNPLIPTQELNQIMLILNGQRDAIVSSMGKSALKAAGIDPSTKQASIAKAQENLDRLLGYQASETVRTKIIDHAEDFETPDHGTNQWATPLEQARQLRNQQRKSRKQNELLKVKRGQGKKVVSVAIRGNKIVQEVEDVVESDEEEEEEKAEPENFEADLEPAFWDAAKHTTKYTTPKYVSSGVKIAARGSPAEARDVVEYSEQDTFMI